MENKLCSSIFIFIFLQGYSTRKTNTQINVLLLALFPDSTRTKRILLGFQVGGLENGFMASCVPHIPFYYLYLSFERERIAEFTYRICSYFVFFFFFVLIILNLILAKRSRKSLDFNYSLQ